MKGIIFLKLEEFVEEKFGEFVWEEILIGLNLESEGAYTANMLYDDQELFSIIDKICKQYKLTSREAQFSFGEWVFEKLLAMAPHGSVVYSDTFSFLRVVNDVIHTEVLKIHPDAILPEFLFLEESEQHMVMEYVSPRGLCYLCDGLMNALTKFLKEDIKISQTQCKHNESEKCIFELVKQ